MSQNYTALCAHLLIIRVEKEKNKDFEENIEF